MTKLEAATNLRDCLLALEEAMTVAVGVHNEHSEDECHGERGGHLTAAGHALKSAHKQLEFAAKCDPDLEPIGSK